MGNLIGMLYGGLGVLAFIVFISFLKSIIKVALPNRIMEEALNKLVKES